jgi:imidazolonepropionase-like amidohydrolase
MNALLASVLVLAGATVWSGEGPPVENATIVIRGERIAAVGRGIPAPRGAQVIELKGAVVTPGLIDVASRLGLVEISTGEPSAVEGTAGGGAPELRASLRTADTYNPRSLPIEVARQDGLTSALVIPAGGVIAGQSAWVALRGSGRVLEDSSALHVSVEEGSSAGTRSRAFLLLREVFEDTRLYRLPGNRGAYIKNGLRTLRPSASDLEVLARALDGELRVVFEVDRAPDILTVLELARLHKLDAVLLGVREGWLEADAIARAGVPVIVDPYENLPDDFNSLRSRDDNALRLLRAGVRVAFASRETPSQAGQLRFRAGNAAARGYPRDDALAAITRIPADLFGRRDEGRIDVGARANLVVWNGDPFEPQSWAQRMFIDGTEIDLRTRQDLLTERYMKATPAPRDTGARPPE